MYPYPHLRKRPGGYRIVTDQLWEALRGCHYEGLNKKKKFKKIFRSVTAPPFTKNNKLKNFPLVTLRVKNYYLLE